MSYTWKNTSVFVGASSPWNTDFNKILYLICIIRFMKNLRLPDRFFKLLYVLSYVPLKFVVCSIWRYFFFKERQFYYPEKKFNSRNLATCCYHKVSTLYAKHTYQILLKSRQNQESYIPFKIGIFQSCC